MQMGTFKIYNALEERKLNFSVSVKNSGPGVVAHTCNPSTLEAKAGGSPEVGSSRPA